jgi:hypothetical protein
MCGAEFGCCGHILNRKLFEGRRIMNEDGCRLQNDINGLVVADFGGGKVLRICGEFKGK